MKHQEKRLHEQSADPVDHANSSRHQDHEEAQNQREE
jgi:hypothetical protein